MEKQKDMADDGSAIRRLSSTVELQYSRIQYSRKLQYSRRFGGDQGFLFNKNPK